MIKDLDFLLKKEKLFKAYMEDLNKLIDCAAEVLGNPIAVGVANNTVWHVSEGMPKDAIIHAVGEVENRNDPLYRRLNDEIYNNKEPVFFQKPGGCYGDYDYLASAIRSQGKIVAFTNVTLCNSKLTESSRALFDIYCCLLSRRLERPGTLSMLTGEDERAWVLKDLISGNYHEMDSYPELSHLKNKKLTILVLNYKDSIANAPPKGAYNKLYNALKDCICFYYENTLVALSVQNTIDYDKLQKLLAEEELCVGFSYPFYQLSEVKMRWEQAHKALHYGKAHSDSIADFSEAVVPWLYELSNGSAHPYSLEIMEYDAKNGTSLALTLFTYLKYNKSIKKSSETLGIHRNTMLQRLGRISEILCVPTNSIGWDVGISLSELLSPII
ncbi:MAG: PucR family transcriptional regulator [Anaerovoracaceae bacterium]|jgi:hypothetical protein